MLLYLTIDHFMFHLAVLAFSLWIKSEELNGLIKDYHWIKSTLLNITLEIRGSSTFTLYQKKKKKVSETIPDFYQGSLI